MPAHGSFRVVEVKRPSLTMLTLNNVMRGTLVLFNACVLLWRARHSFHTTSSYSSRFAYQYSPLMILQVSIGDEYQVMLNVGELNPIAMTLHEFRRQGLGIIARQPTRSWGASILESTTGSSPRRSCVNFIACESSHEHSIDHDRSLFRSDTSTTARIICVRLCCAMQRTHWRRETLC